MGSTHNEPAPGSPTIEDEVEALRARIKAHRFVEAVDAGRRLIEAVPENRDALYLLALAQRQANRPLDALATLERLERWHPRFGRLYQERGHCYTALKDAPRAIEAFRLAVQVNGTLSASWSMLAGLYRMIGDAAAAAFCAEQVAKLDALPAEVVAATHLYCDGELVAAEKRIRAFLLRNGDHIEAMRLLARIGADLNVHDDAEILLAAVLERAPEHAAARQEYASVLIARHRYPQARTELERLLAMDPGNRVYRTLYAGVVAGLGDQADAIRRYRELLAEAPAAGAEAAELHLSAGHALKTLGRRAEGIDEYRAAYLARPDFGDAYWSLANLKTYRFTDAELERMSAAEAAPTTGIADRYHLCFALGKGHEDRGDFALSWRYYERGNALKRAESRYRPEVIERNTANQQSVCTREFFRARAGYGARSAEPIFIVGLPRSGSTLIEQILASHSEVEGTQELAIIPEFVHELQGREPDLDSPRYPAALAKLPAEAFARLAQRYLDETRVYRSGKPRFIDKMPNNFRHVGLLHLLFPNSAIVDARREPMACCFSNYKQLFARGQEFAYSIDDIARYYRTYLELMAHWDAVLPGRVLRVHHQDVVDDLERGVRRLLDHCGLAYEPACVEFHRTERSVRTASSEQVRQPIFRDGLDHWRRFEPWLGPLRDALGDAPSRYLD